MLNNTAYTQTHYTVHDYFKRHIKASEPYFIRSLAQWEKSIKLLYINYPTSYPKFIYLKLLKEMVKHGHIVILNLIWIL